MKTTTRWEKALLRRAAAAITLLAATSAPAQTTPSDIAFFEGKALMEQGRTAEACEKFAESLALERRGGVMLNLAVCREKQGRYVTALTLFHEARERASKDGRPDRVALAEEHIATAEKRVSWLMVRVSPGADDPALEVRCDQEPLPRKSWGTLHAVDPGPHTVWTTAPGRPRFEVTVVVGPDGDSRTVEIPAPPAEAARPAPPAEVASPAPPAVAASPAPPAEATRAAEAPPAEAPGSMRALRTPIGAAITGVGAAVTIAGAVFGVKTIVDVRDTDLSCPDDVCTDPAAFRQNQDAHTAAHVADIAIPTGLAVTGAGLYLLLRRSPAAADVHVASTIVRFAPAVAQHGASLAVRASW